MCLPRNSSVLLGNQHADQSFHYTHEPELKWTLSTAHSSLYLCLVDWLFLPSINPFIGRLLLQVQMITPKKDSVLFSVMNFQPSLPLLCLDNCCNASYLSSRSKVSSFLFAVWSPSWFFKVLLQQLPSTPCINLYIIYIYIFPAE